uniref:Auxin-responsive protein n=1 Tax=Aegilops tauschii subsp. strangulata TaxID=200361 RepID=A0A453E9K2_AEGTS
CRRRRSGAPRSPRRRPGSTSRTPRSRSPCASPATPTASAAPPPPPPAPSPTAPPSSPRLRRPPSTRHSPSPSARVVGWPPVRSFRKNALENVAAGSTRAACAPAKFVKVAVDGAPYLRKVNLRDYAGYDQLLRALQGKFCSHFTIRKFANDEMKLVDAVNGTEYVPTYEDKDGDWMLVGDVPWK